MNIQDQVCTFDQAAAIYSYGVRIENAAYWWYQNKNTGENAVFSPYEYLQGDDWVKVFPAPNVAEFGKILPVGVDKDRQSHKSEPDYYLSCRKSWNEFYCEYLSSKNNKPLFYEIGRTEAKARAEAYIWLLENNYIIEKGIVLV